MTMLSRYLALVGAGYMVVYRGRLLYWGDLVEFNGAGEGPEQHFSSRLTCTGHTRVRTDELQT